MDIGHRIKELRIQKNLTQEELADRCELTKGFISQVERDHTSPSIATLMDILQCLGTDLSSFFTDETNDDQIVFHQNDYFEKKDEELHNKIEWIIPNAQKNIIEPIRLTLAPGGSTYPDIRMKAKNSVMYFPEAFRLFWAAALSEPKKVNPFISNRINNIISKQMKKTELSSFGSAVPPVFNPPILYLLRSHKL